MNNNHATNTCMLFMASCSCSKRWAELSASRRMSVSLRSFSHSSVRSSDTTFSSVPSPPSQSLEMFRRNENRKDHLFEIAKLRTTPDTIVPELLYYFLKNKNQHSNICSQTAELCNYLVYTSTFDNNIKIGHIINCDL